MKNNLRAFHLLVRFCALPILLILISCSDKGDTVVEPENRPPNINSPAAVMALIDALFSYTATATDADGTTPAIHFENIPSWTDTSGNTISGTPDESTPDTSFTVIAADDFLADTLVVTVDVTDVLPSVSYSDDIQPIFDNNCAGSSCHIGGNAGGLRLNNWTNLIAGGSSGDAVVPGNADISFLIRRIEGDIPPTMPLGGSELAPATIQEIRDWIDEGALNN